MTSTSILTPSSTTTTTTTYPSMSNRTIEDAGDAGFLVPFLFPELFNATSEIEDASTKSKRACVVPHRKDESSSVWRTKKVMIQQEKESLVDIEKLLVGIGWQTMAIKMYEKCQAIVSSSLHGIIFAESLGIPNTRLRLSDQPGDYKFSDFYMSYRGIMGPPPVTVPDPNTSSSNHLQSSFDNVLQPKSYLDREKYAQRVLKSFPIHLFHVV